MVPGSWRVIGGYGDDVAGGTSAPAAASLDQAFLPAVFVYLEREALTEWQVSLEATVGTKELDSMVRIAGSYPVASHVRVSGELDVISGAATTFWGRWRDNDRLRVFLSSTTRDTPFFFKLHSDVGDISLFSQSSPDTALLREKCPQHEQRSGKNGSVP